MTDPLLEQIHGLIDGTLDADAHQALQQRLLTDAAARAIYRERMDVEAALHTWAVEESDISPTRPAAHRVAGESGFHRTPTAVTLATVVATLAIAALLTAVVWQKKTGHQQVIAETPTAEAGDLTLGQLFQQADCQWGHGPAGGRFSTGRLELTDGVAELRFDSGTRVILESPCTVDVDSGDTARLLDGNVFVVVSEVSNGFLLTTPDARIVDEATQYAVACDAEGTEVHVFDGSVQWMTTDTSSAESTRIESGEARRFSRSNPGSVLHVPFGQRQFVRQLEADLRDAAGTALLAYDGFENLAGRMRRGRSGFGWVGGWESAGRSGGPLGEIRDAPQDTVFQMSRQGRRLLVADGGMDMRRSLATSLDVTATAVYVSVLARRVNGGDGFADPAPDPRAQTAFQLLLEPNAVSPRFTRRHSVSFGVTSNATAFVNNAGRVRESVTKFADNQTCLLVFRFSASPSDRSAALRVYPPGAAVDSGEPDAWSIADVAAARSMTVRSVRLITGNNGQWQFDELKIGSSWAAVLPSTAVPQTAPTDASVENWAPSDTRHTAAVSDQP